MKKSALQSLRWVKPTEGKAKAAAKPKLLGTPAADSAQAEALRAAIFNIGVPEPVAENLTVLEEARLLLRAVAEVEHALLVQYLYAAYSIVPANAAALHQRTLIGIAVEEMGHLLTMQNLLIALGTPPYFDRAQTTFDGAAGSDLPFPLRLEPLTRAALSKYVTTESPLPEFIPDAPTRDRIKAIAQDAEQAAERAIRHVGLLFAKLFWLFQPTDAPHPLWPELPTDELRKLAPGRHLKVTDFVDSGEAWQAKPEEFGQDPADPETGENLYIVLVRSRIEALYALDLIAEQGEGFKLGQSSHFERFLGMYDRFEAELAAHIAPVAVNPHTSNAASGQPLPPASDLWHWGKLFNARYEMLLLKLTLGLLQRPAANAARPLSRQELFDSSRFDEMQALSFMAQRLAGLSVAGSAGAPFELPETPLPTDEAGLRLSLRAAIETSRLEIAHLRPLFPDDEWLFEQLSNVDQELLTALDAS